MSLIAKAAELLSSEDRWVKGRPFAGGRMCLWGALCTIAGNEGLTDQEGYLDAAGEKLREIIREQYPDRLSLITVSVFNDHPDTTFADVRLVLEKAMAREEEG